VIRCAVFVLPTADYRRPSPVSSSNNSITTTSTQRPVEAALLAIDADLAEAEAAVEGHAGGVEGEGGEDELVVAEAAGLGDEGAQEGAADAAAAGGALDVDGEVGDEAVGGARVEGVEGAPADDLAPAFGDEDRMAGVAAGEPGAALVRGAFLRFQRRQAVDDPLVVDVGDDRRVGLGGGADGDRWSSWRAQRSLRRR